LSILSIKIATGWIFMRFLITNMRVEKLLRWLFNLVSSMCILSEVVSRSWIFLPFHLQVEIFRLRIDLVQRSIHSQVCLLQGNTSMDVILIVCQWTSCRHSRLKLPGDPSATILVAKLVFQICVTRYLRSADTTSIKCLHFKGKKKNMSHMHALVTLPHPDLVHQHKSFRLAPSLRLNDWLLLRPQRVQD